MLIEDMIERYIRIFNRLFGNKRLLVVIGAISGGLAALSFFSAPFLHYFEQLFYFNLQKTSIPITFLLVSVASFSIIYLQSGGKNTAHEDSEGLIKKLYYELEVSKKRFEQSREELSYLREKFESLNKINDISEEEKRKIIESIIEKNGEESIGKIFETKVFEIKNDLETNSKFEVLRKSTERIASRIRREISDLRLRSNINLILGMLITILGLYLLWSTVSMVDSSELLKQLASEGNDSNYKFIKNLILPIVPRVLLVIFIEIFAYFFLKLYRDCLSEIKYFQNELTNVESKLISAEYAFVANCQDSLKNSLEALAKTERNFILEKNQTTVELEKAKSDSELTKNIINGIPALFKKANK